MAAPKGKFQESEYRPEYAETASQLCAKFGYIDVQLAEWFKVDVRTIHRWKLAHPEFSDALRVGKAETDDLVERGTVAGINGYYVDVDEMDRFGNVKTMRKWIAGNPHAGMKWLAARRPEQYREQKEVKHQLSMDDAFLRFLEEMEAAAIREKIACAPRTLTAIGTGPVIVDVECEVITEVVCDDDTEDDDDDDSGSGPISDLA